jgi:hypothetical protein
MSGQVIKLLKIGFPFRLDKTDTGIVITDCYQIAHKFNDGEWTTIKEKSLDSDGFLLLEITSPELRKALPHEVQAGINGYMMFYSSIPKSKSHGVQKSIYEYFKRDIDGEYYVRITKEGSQPFKMRLGKLDEPNGKLFPFTQKIEESFKLGEKFDREILDPKLPEPLRSRRIMKAVLDILTAEGFLRKTESKLRGKLHEQFEKTDKLTKFIIDSKWHSKPNGTSVGQAMPTSSQLT